MTEGAREPAAAPAARRAGLRAWGPPALILVAAAIVQGSALRLPFFADDYLFLDQVRFRSLIGTLLSRDPIGNFIRPVSRQVWFWAISRLGESPVVGHALNLAVFLGALAVLYAIARRLAGARAAAIATGLVALHYAADVPVRWVSGSQDLLATLGALATVALFLSGRVALASVALALALLSKETVALTPLVAAVAARRRAEPWRAALRRAWPLGAVTAVWAVIWVARLRHGPAAGVGFSAGAIPATFVHLAQVLVGAEWRRDDPVSALRTIPPLALVPVLAAIAWARAAKRTSPAPAAREAKSRRADRRAARAAPPAPAAPRGDAVTDPILTGVLWAIAGTLPVIAVASIWSAYYYLFALCGAALALGAWLRRAPTAPVLVLVALLGWSSESARRMAEFESGQGPWSVQSHVNRFYVDRALVPIGQFLAELKQQRPTLPRNSTLYFSGVPGFIGWQAADGPLVRWAYRDSSLHSYFATEFGTHPRRGPYFVFEVVHDSLVEVTSKPGLLPSMAIAQVLDEKIESARNTMLAELEQHPQQRSSEYLLAWIDMALGDTAVARARLRSAEMNLAGPPTPQLADARALLAARDSVTALRVLGVGLVEHVLDPAVHAAVADLVFAHNPSDPYAATEAFAARVLAPHHPASWWRWTVMQATSRRPVDALRSFRTFYALAGPELRSDPRVAKLLDYLNRSQPGGENTQKWLRRGTSTAH